MDRRHSTQDIIANLRRRARSTAAALSTTDGRWALVSTSITALVAGSMAWLAATAMPPLHTRANEASTTLLPYRLFTQLVQAGDALVGRSPAQRAAPPPAQLDRNLADEEAGDDNGSATPGTETHTITLDKGDTLTGVLTDGGVNDADAAAAVAALVKVYDVKNMRAGTTLTLTFEAVPQKPVQPEKPVAAPLPRVIYGAPPAGTIAGDDEDDADSGDVTPVVAAPVGRLLSIAFSPSVEHDVTIARNADNSFTATDAVKELVAHQHRAGATLDGSLYLAGMQAGIPAGIMVDMIKLFAYKIDFQRDLRPGDAFEVYYSFYYTPDGLPAREGNIDYALIRTRGHEYRLYRYQPNPDQAAEYYDEHGASLKGMLMKTPVDGARISSGFGMRFHPVLGYTRMHKGIDFAVPVGTPVMASGTGVVKIAGRSSGYGNYLRVDMGNGYGFAYGHLSRFAPGVHVGSRVRQGQVVAYSGNTGLSTGPHLHYETLVNNTQVNPLTLKIAQGRILSGHDLVDFKYTQLHLDAVLASTPLETKVADAASDLRQAKAR
ncbi:MAG: peptidoglycan DD-metalloendopeptidase family protein [Rhizomicrobium sp.]